MAEITFDPQTTQLGDQTPSSRIREIVDTLFGHSQVLDQHLVPALHADLAARSRALPNYESFIDLCVEHVGKWDYREKGEFLSGHPEIGAPKVSGLSAKEQGTAAVDPKTLERLKTLNGRYRELFPGLIYLTFVNGRSREAIADELEAFLAGISPDVTQPTSDEWKKECDRGVAAVIEISRDRLKKLGWDQPSTR